MKKKSEPIECQNQGCDVKFIPSRPWQRYHSDACRAEAHKNEGPLESKCIYCGLGAEDIDHVPAQAWRPIIIEKGLEKEFPFVEVKACHECNIILSAKPLWTVDSRKRYIKKYLVWKYKKYLNVEGGLTQRL